MTRDKVKVSPEDALLIFENLMTCRESDVKTVLYNYQKYNFDFNWLISCIPVDNLKKRYISRSIAPESEHNTFLNRLMLSLHGLEEELTSQTLDYLVRNSDCRENWTLHLYFYINSLDIFNRMNIDSIVFSKGSVDYLLDSIDYDTNNQPHWLKKLKRQDGDKDRGYSTLAFCLEAMGGLSNLKIGLDKIHEKFLTLEQLRKIIDNTSLEETQKYQKEILYDLSQLNSWNNNLEEADLLKIITKFSFDTVEKRSEFIPNTFSFWRCGQPGRFSVERTDNKKGLEFLNLCEKVHGIDWMELFLKEDRISWQFLRNLDLLSKACLEECLFNRGLKIDNAVREGLNAYPYSREVLTEYEIRAEQKLLNEGIKINESSLVNQEGERRKTVKV